MHSVILASDRLLDLLVLHLGRRLQGLRNHALIPALDDGSRLGYLLDLRLGPRDNLSVDDGSRLGSLLDLRLGPRDNLSVGSRRESHQGMKCDLLSCTLRT